MADESDLLKRQKYALARRRGYTTTEAAERAGLAGRPSGDARRLEGLVTAESAGDDTGLRQCIDAVGELVKAPASAKAFRKARLEQALETVEDVRRQLQLRIEAVEVLLVEEQSSRQTDPPPDSVA